MPRRAIPGTGKRQPLNMRTTAELRRKIERAAGKSGRSLVQEVEYRVERSFQRERHDVLAGVVEEHERRMNNLQALQHRMEEQFFKLETMWVDVLQAQREMCAVVGGRQEVERVHG